MPVLRIHGLRPPGLDVPSLLQSASAAVAEAFQCPPEQCWALFLEIKDQEYLEGGTLRRASDGTHSPVAVLSSYQGRSEEQIAQALGGIASAITTTFGYEPGDVFVEYHELTKGRVFTGGDVR